jgi:arabinose-5-phosphate isomerase
MVTQAFELMEKHSISQLIVTQEGEYVGVIHIHDLIKEGIY